jgi:hypothetical protein
MGKPYSGKLNVRFDEGELEIERMPLRQFSTLLFSGNQRSGLIRDTSPIYLTATI